MESVICGLVASNRQSATCLVFCCPFQIVHARDTVAGTFLIGRHLKHGQPLINFVQILGRKTGFGGYDAAKLRALLIESNSSCESPNKRWGSKKMQSTSQVI